MVKPVWDGLQKPLRFAGHYPLLARIRLPEQAVCMSQAMPDAAYRRSFPLRHLRGNKKASLSAGFYAYKNALGFKALPFNASITSVKDNSPSINS
jgi:hypothetical protein